MYECCKYPENPKLCQNRGYLSYAEVDQTLKLKPSAILNALKYFYIQFKGTTLQEMGNNVSYFSAHKPYINLKDGLVSSDKSHIAH